MKRRTTLYATIVCGAGLSLAALGIGAAVDHPRTLMSPGDYGVAKKAIEAETRIAFATCRPEQGLAKDVCKAEVRAEERVKKGDLYARYHGTVAAAEEAQGARTKAAYDVARAKCGNHVGEERVSCLRAAREDRTRTLAEAKPRTT